MKKVRTSSLTEREPSVHYTQRITFTHVLPVHFKGPNDRQKYMGPDTTTITVYMSQPDLEVYTDTVKSTGNGQSTPKNSLQ